MKNLYDHVLSMSIKFFLIFIYVSTKYINILTLS
jgi:hypothetical protein